MNRSGFVGAAGKRFGQPDELPDFPDFLRKWLRANFCRISVLHCAGSGSP